MPDSFGVDAVRARIEAAGEWLDSHQDGLRFGVALVEDDRDAGYAYAHVNPDAVLESMQRLLDTAPMSVALLAILDLHYPEPWNISEGVNVCCQCEHLWPCDTVTAISEAFNS